MKFQIDARAFERLVNREDTGLGEAIVGDIETALRLSMPEGTRRMVIVAFEAGYTAGLNNVVKLLETPLPANPPVERGH